MTSKYLTPAASAASRRKAKTLSGHFLGRTFHKEQDIRDLRCDRRKMPDKVFDKFLVFSLFLSYDWRLGRASQEKEKKKIKELMRVALSRCVDHEVFFVFSCSWSTA